MHSGVKRTVTQIPPCLNFPIYKPGNNLHLEPLTQIRGEEAHEGTPVAAVGIQISPQGPNEESVLTCMWFVTQEILSLLMPG